MGSDQELISILGRLVKKNNKNEPVVFLLILSPIEF